jgi:hypothetical protein
MQGGNEKDKNPMKTSGETLTDKVLDTRIKPGEHVETAGSLARVHAVHEVGKSDKVGV